MVCIVASASAATRKRRADCRVPPFLVVEDTHCQSHPCTSPPGREPPFPTPHYTPVEVPPRVRGREFRLRFAPSRGPRRATERRRKSPTRFTRSQPRTQTNGCPACEPDLSNERISLAARGWEAGNTRCPVTFLLYIIGPLATTRPEGPARASAAAARTYAHSSRRMLFQSGRLQTSGRSQVFCSVWGFSSLKSPAA